MIFKCLTDYICRHGYGYDWDLGGAYVDCFHLLTALWVLFWAPINTGLFCRLDKKKRKILDLSVFDESLKLVFCRIYERKTYLPS